MTVEHALRITRRSGRVAQPGRYILVQGGPTAPYPNTTIIPVTAQLPVCNVTWVAGGASLRNPPAARRLGLTQPTMARHVDALQAALGTDLFAGSQRGLEPTDLARSLRPYARTMA